MDTNEEVEKKLVEQISKIETLWKPKEQGGNPKAVAGEVNSLLQLSKGYVNSNRIERNSFLEDIQKRKRKEIQDRFIIEGIKQKSSEETKFRIKQAIEILSPILTEKDAMQKAQSYEPHEYPAHLEEKKDEVEDSFEHYHNGVQEHREETVKDEEIEKKIKTEFKGRASGEDSIVRDIKDMFKHLSWSEARAKFRRFFEKKEKSGGGFKYGLK